MNQPLAIALAVVAAKLWIHCYTGQTFKLTGVWLTRVKEFGIPPDYYHIHWFSMQCFRSSIAIICCAAVDQNRLFKVQHQKRKENFTFPMIHVFAKYLLPHIHRVAYDSPWLTWHGGNIELESVESNHEETLCWPGHKLADFRVGQKKLSNSWQIPTPQLDAMNQILNYLLSVKKLNSPRKDSDSMQYYYYYYYYYYYFYYYNYYRTVLWHHWQWLFMDSEYQIQSIDSWSSWSGDTEHQPTDPPPCTN